MADHDEALTTPEDPIVAEVRATRAALSATAGDDLERIYAQLKALEARERAAGREILAAPARPRAAA